MNQINLYSKIPVNLTQHSRMQVYKKILHDSGSIITDNRLIRDEGF